MANYNKVFSVKAYYYYYRLQRTLAWFAYSIVLGVDIEGQENIDFSRPFLILSNHASHLDPPLIGIAVHKPIAYMTKHSLFKIPVINRLLHWSGAYQVNRQGKDNSFIDNTLYALRNGWLVTIFPEGARSPDGKFGRVKTGAARILLAEPYPFLPVAVIDTHKAWPRDTMRINLRSRVKVKIGKPVYPEEFLPDENLTEEEKIKHIAAIYSTKINELLPEDQKPVNQNSLVPEK